jgi:hypothetical protein
VCGSRKCKYSFDRRNNTPCQKYVYIIEYKSIWFSNDSVDRSDSVIAWNARMRALWRASLCSTAAEGFDLHGDTESGSRETERER